MTLSSGSSLMVIAPSALTGVLRSGVAERERLSRLRLLDRLSSAAYMLSVSHTVSYITCSNYYITSRGPLLLHHYTVSHFIHKHTL